MRILTAAALATIVAGCASRSSDITPAYVSPITYQNHNCQQLAMEAQAISARAAQVSGAQDQKRTNDQIATGVAIVVFWPAAFSSSVAMGRWPQSWEISKAKWSRSSRRQSTSTAQSHSNGQQRAQRPRPSTRRLPRRRRVRQLPRGQRRLRQNENRFAPSPHSRLTAQLGTRGRVIGRPARGQPAPCRHRQ